MTEELPSLGDPHREGSATQARKCIIYARPELYCVLLHRIHKHYTKWRYHVAISKVKLQASSHVVFKLRVKYEL